MSSIGAFDINYDITDPKYLNKYMNSPLEYQAFKIGANNKSIHDRINKFDPEFTKISLNKKKLKSAIKSGKFQIDPETQLKQMNIDPTKYSSQEEFENHIKNSITPRFKK